MTPEQANGMLIGIWLGGMAVVLIVGRTWGALTAVEVVIGMLAVLAAVGWWRGRI